MSQNEHPLLDISRDDIVPYFMWDYQYTVGQVKEMLANGSEAERLWLMAKIMRDARYCDVWEFMSLQDFLSNRKRLTQRLGWKKGFWKFLYSRWIQYGILRGEDDSYCEPK